MSGRDPMCAPSSIICDSQPSSCQSGRYVGWESMGTTLLWTKCGCRFEVARNNFAEIGLSSGRDTVSWKLEPCRVLFTGSLYKEIFKAAPRVEIMGIWKAKIPAKILIFCCKWTQKIPDGYQVFDVTATASSSDVS